VKHIVSTVVLRNRALSDCAVAIFSILVPSYLTGNTAVSVGNQSVYRLS
jgi:hypothetical protein